MKNKIIIIILMILLLSISTLIIKNYNSNNSSQQDQEKEEVFSESEENVILAEYIETLEDGTLENNSEKLKENKKFDGLEITRILLTGEDNEMTMLIDIKNTTTQTKGDKEVTLVMKDKDGNKIGKIGVNILKLQSKQTSTLELKTGLNFINTYDFEILDEKLTL